MKRDARIGLAVVLVLGLAVTLLIGRSLYKRAPLTGEADGDIAGDGTAPYSSDAHRSDGVEMAAAPAVAAAPPVTAPSISAPPRESAARPTEHPAAIQKFVEDQTRKIPAPEQPVAGIGKPVASPGAPSTPAAQPVSPAGGAAPDLEDHEQAGPPAPPSGGDVSADGYGYTVGSGDNMWKISAKVYGDGKYTQKIVEANPHLNLQRMKVGTVVRIPVIANKTVLMKLPSFAEAAKTPRNAPADNPAARHAADSGQVAAETRVSAPVNIGAPAAATTHKVEGGETLSSIAKKYYGVAGPKTIARIIAANNGLEPSKLKTGQEINIPAKQ